MDYLQSILIAGFAGGALRALTGYIKSKSLSKKEVHFRPLSFLATTGVSGAVGLLAAWVSLDLNLTFLTGIPITPAIASVIGYAGGDFLESLYKIFSKTSSLTKS